MLGTLCAPPLRRASACADPPKSSSRYVHVRDGRASGDLSHISWKRCNLGLMVHNFSWPLAIARRSKATDSLANLREHLASWPAWSGQSPESAW